MEEYKAVHADIGLNKPLLTMHPRKRKTPKYFIVITLVLHPSDMIPFYFRYKMGIIRFHILIFFLCISILSNARELIYSKDPFDEDDYQASLLE